ncbi:MAG: efflux RND transporter periplasmic adaptor subunit, partial [Negativicutes bacterium]|nr:efflux RND transporter periplasmic adaptor subunit [Negativicutes bacterium]
MTDKRKMTAAGLGHGVAGLLKKRGITGKRGLTAWIASALIMAGLWAAGCGKQEQLAAPAVPVSVATVEQKTMPRQIAANGLIEAYNSVAVVPQATGRIVEVGFRQGSYVRAGDLLAVIDPSTYAADLRAAEAVIAQQKSQTEFKQAQAERYAELWRKQAVSYDQYEYYQSQAVTQEAAYRNAQAAAEVLRIKLERCYIRSPIEGVAGEYLADVGTLVTENSGRLVTV